MPEQDLKALESHFRFGENWSRYSRLIDEERVALAVDSLRRLSGADDLAGRTFLDIGCGSGLHAVAAARLKASRIVALDIDPDSVNTTRQVLQEHAPGTDAQVQQLSVFETDPQKLGRFDVVYSWGVLHHTGSMHEALRKAAALLNPGGIFIFALYRKTPLCWFWTREKKWYAHAPEASQERFRNLYIGTKRVVYTLSGRSFDRYIANYGQRYRGMDFYHDVHDWLGGYPYESITPRAAERFMKTLGLELVREFTRPGWYSLFGSGCNEYVYARGRG